MVPTAKKTTRTRPSALLTVLGFGALICGLLALTLAFEGPRVALREHMESLGPTKTKRLVYVETAPMGAAVNTGGTDSGYMALKFRIGLPDKQKAKELEAIMPKFYGEMARSFDLAPVAAEPESGKLNLMAIEARVRGLLDDLLGPGVVGSVRVVEVRRKLI